MLYLLDNFGDVANLSMNVKNPQWDQCHGTNKIVTWNNISSFELERTKVFGIVVAVVFFKMFFILKHVKIYIFLFFKNYF